VIHLRFKGGQVCRASTARDCAGCIHAAPGALRRALSGLAVERYRRETAEAFARHKTIFVSDFLRHAFLRAMPGADLSRTRVIHNFISYPALRSSAASAGAVRPGEVLLAGRIDTGKGFGEFLEAARGALPPHTLLSIIGDGPLRPSLEARHAGPRVHFLGWRPYDEVIRRSAASHLCVVPSVWEEPCGTTVLEALALGKQCLALARGGTPELAAYQYYDGQLRLAASMPELVALLAAELVRAPLTVALPERWPSDVFEVLPAILDCYAE
jgi:glycosyltransferase involved in cell wall biosynthesis